MKENLKKKQKNIRSKNKPYCFICMPFDPKDKKNDTHFENVFSDIFKPAVENLGFICETAKDVISEGVLIEKILLSIEKAELVIIDLTLNSPSVMYELGVRHALSSKGTIMVAESKKYLPTNLEATDKFFTYSPEIGASKEFEKNLKDMLDKIKGSEKDSLVFKFLKHYHQAFEENSRLKSKNKNLEFDLSDKKNEIDNLKQTLEEYRDVENQLEAKKQEYEELEQKYSQKINEISNINSGIDLLISRSVDFNKIILSFLKNHTEVIRKLDGIGLLEEYKALTINELNTNEIAQD